MSCFASLSPRTAAIAALLASSAFAGDVSYTLSGTITAAIAPASVTTPYPVGTAYTLVVTWDPAASSQFLSATQGKYPLKELTLTLDADPEWSTSSVVDAASFTVGYESGGAVDSIQFTSGWGPDSHTHKTIGDLQPYSVNVTLADPTGTALPGLNAAPTELELADWSTDVANSYFKFYLNNNGNQFLQGDVRSITVTGAGPGTDALGITGQPASQAVAVGGEVSFSVTASGTGLTYQWYHDGELLDAATGATLALTNVQPEHAGLYAAVVSNAEGSVTTDAVTLGITASGAVAGDAAVVQDNIPHPNGNAYDQRLLTGDAATLTARPGAITRISYLDLSDDIVQVEFSGAGALTLKLENVAGPAAPTQYNQPTVAYMKGHARITIAGADETTNVSVFTVGRMTAFDPTGTFDFLQPAGAGNNPATSGSPLFVGHANTVYDGVADLAALTIHSRNGRFGGIRAANASFLATKGVTGIHAPGIAFAGPVFLHDVSAADTATPVILLGVADDVRVTGGSLSQDNAAPVQVSGIVALTFTAGTNSHGMALPAQANAAVLEEDGEEITGDIVVKPSDTDDASLVTKELTFEFSGSNPPFVNGAKKTFQVSQTTLKFDDKTLTNATPLILNAPMSGVKFTDETTGLVWEVYFRNGVLHEINLVRNGQFAGQWS